MTTGVQEKRIKTDVLVIGGGLAGCFAAIKAAEHGVNVTLVDKSHVAHSGSNATGIDHFPYCFIPEVHGPLGYKVEDFVKAHIRNGLGITDHELCEMMWQDSYERLLDLERIGIKIRYEKIFPWNFGYEPGDYSDDPKFRIIPWGGFPVPPALNIAGLKIKAKLYAKLKELGIDILNFYSAQDFLTIDGSVVGAVGFNIRTGEFIVIEGKATVLATGWLNRIAIKANIFGDSLLPPNQTAEGQTMAFRAGAELAIMEGGSASSRTKVLLGAMLLKNFERSSPATPSGYPAGRIVNAAGDVMPTIGKKVSPEYEGDIFTKQEEWVRKSISDGKTPFYWDATAASEEERKYAEWSSTEEGLGTEFFRHLREDLKADIATHQIELEAPKFIKPNQPMGAFNPTPFSITSPSGIVVNKEVETTLKNLYAAGQVAYGIHFPAAPWPFASGARAGQNSAERAQKSYHLKADENQIDAFKERIYAPLKVKKQRVMWHELNLEINNILQSYLTLNSKESLKMGLQYIEDLKKENLGAKNPHELMRLMETLSLLTVSEIFFRAALSSRKSNEWRILKKVDGKMEFTGRPIVQKYQT